MLLQHLQNTNEIVYQEILVCLGNRIQQCLNLIGKPRGNLADGTTLFGIWQAHHANIIHRPLQLHAEVMQLLAVANLVSTKIFLQRS
jgi:hypothetical protein